MIKKTFAVVLLAAISSSFVYVNTADARPCKIVKKGCIFLPTPGPVPAPK